MKKRYKTIFLDRDGTLNIDPGYISKLKNFKFYNFTFDALKLFDDRGEPGDTTDDYTPPENNYPDNMVSRGHLTAGFLKHAHLAAVPVTHHANLTHTSHMANPSLAEYAGSPLGKDNTLSKEEADGLIMSARKIVYKD